MSEREHLRPSSALSRFGGPPYHTDCPQAYEADEAFFKNLTGFQFALRHYWNHGEEQKLDTLIKLNRLRAFATLMDSRAFSIIATCEAFEIVTKTDECWLDSFRNLNVASFMLALFLSPEVIAKAPVGDLVNAKHCYFLPSICSFSLNQQSCPQFLVNATNESDIKAMLFVVRVQLTMVLSGYQTFTDIPVGGDSIKQKVEKCSRVLLNKDTWGKLPISFPQRTVTAHVAAKPPKRQPAGVATAHAAAKRQPAGVATAHAAAKPPKRQPAGVATATSTAKNGHLAKKLKPNTSLPLAEKNAQVGATAVTATQGLNAKMAIQQKFHLLDVKEAVLDSSAPLPDKMVVSTKTPPALHLTETKKAVVDCTAPLAAAVVSTEKARARQRQIPREKVFIGARVEVWWPAYQKFYAGVVTKKRNSGKGKGKHFVEYDDGDKEWMSFQKETYRLLAPRL